MKVIKRKIIETVYQEETNTLEYITTEYFFNIHESELSNILDNLRDNQKLFLPNNSHMNIRNPHYIPEKFNLNKKYEFFPVFLFDTLHHISEKPDLIQALKGQTFTIITTEPIEKP